MNKKQKTAISPTREENYPEWYQQVVKEADLAENSPVRGCMVIKPWGYALWENIQKDLDERFKETGHVNAYFPLFIPLSFLEKEAQHVEGFAKECAVVTHHRLEPGKNGKLVPAGELEEPLVVRPTSETIIGAMFAKWTKSYRDLPILINQWANIVRWEMRTRLFLRTTEFLWQEGHTAHASKEEAVEETNQMLDVYSDFAYDMMAIPVIKGEKTSDERFPGAVNTYTIEAMMQDGKALQSGTSHFLGQNFAKAQEIKFLNNQEKEEYAWTTSWGVSTRLIGGIIMAHSDDNGFVLPPKLAPTHVIIIPIFKTPEEEGQILSYTKEIIKAVKQQSYNKTPIRISIDKKDEKSSNKVWKYIKQGVPIRLEIGPRDVEKGTVFMGRRDRDPKDKQDITKENFIKTVTNILEEIQVGLLQRATQFRDNHSKEIKTLGDFKEFFDPKNKIAGFAYCHATDDSSYAEVLKDLKVSARCIPLVDNEITGNCIFSGKANCKKIIFARAY